MIAVEIYIRVSTEEQEEGYSKFHQIKICTDHCIKKKYNIKNIIIETGSAFKGTRSKLNNFITKVTTPKNKINMLIIYSFERFSRNEKYGIECLDTLIKHNVSVESASDNLNYNNDLDKEKIKNLIQIFEGYSKTLSKKATDSYNFRKEYGLLKIRETFGFQYKDTHKTTLIANVHEQKIIKFIILLKYNICSIDDIMEILNDFNIDPKIDIKNTIVSNKNNVYNNKNISDILNLLKLYKKNENWNDSSISKILMKFQFSIEYGAIIYEKYIIFLIFILNSQSVPNYKLKQLIYILKNKILNTTIHTILQFPTIENNLCDSHNTFILSVDIIDENYILFDDILNNDTGLPVNIEINNTDMFIDNTDIINNNTNNINNNIDNVNNDIDYMVIDNINNNTNNINNNIDNVNNDIDYMVIDNINNITSILNYNNITQRGTTWTSNNIRKILECHYFINNKILKVYIYGYTDYEKRICSFIYNINKIQNNQLLIQLNNLSNDNNIKNEYIPNNNNIDKYSNEKILKILKNKKLLYKSNDWTIDNLKQVFRLKKTQDDYILNELNTLSINNDKPQNKKRKI
jgi:DNA invertase Pin-like site-specific DNA recombinase